jgi:hypothetical protein
MPLFARLARAAGSSILVASALWLSSCRTPPPPPPPPPAGGEQKPTALFEWNGGDKPITHITINVDEQRAHLFQGKKEAGWTYVATGITSFPTPTGEFKVHEKVQNKVSNLYGKSYTATGDLSNSDFKVGRDLVPAGGRFEPAKMPYFMRLTGDGVGMHIGPIPRPGRRASHGCIRLPSKMAPIIYERINVGTPVAIVGTGPDYQSYLKQSAEKARANAAKLADAKKKAAEAAVEAAAATSLPPGDPNGPAVQPAPIPAPGSSVITTLPAGAPSGSSPSAEVKPAESVGGN